MLILIAPENDIPNEIEILHQFFQEGLQYYHLRKPTKNYQAHCDYLNQIDEQYHNRIVVHHFHELINEFNLKGIHFTEQKRIDHIDNPGQYFKGLSMFGKTISSSFHKPEDLANCEFEFDYHFLSPVFSSISKEGYEGKSFDVNHIDKRIIALGGITTQNIPKALNLGYNGVAVLGSVWKSNSPITAFKKIRNHYTQTITHI